MTDQSVPDQGMTGKSRGADHFKDLYAANPDPWNFAGSDYERLKYDATMAILGTRRFTAGFEVGCSIGILTRRLAANCGNLLAIDIVPSALADAARNCADLRHVAFAVMTIPDQWPEQDFDLVVLSEVLYFFAPADIAAIAEHSCRRMRPGGAALLVNYTGPTGGDPSSGDAAAEIFIAACGARMQVTAHHRAPKYRIDLLEPR